MARLRQEQSARADQWQAAVRAAFLAAFAAGYVAVGFHRRDDPGGRRCFDLLEWKLWREMTATRLYQRSSIFQSDRVAVDDEALAGLVGQRQRRSGSLGRPLWARLRRRCGYWRQRHRCVRRHAKRGAHC